jgi:WD40 repeat protein
MHPSTETSREQRLNEALADYYAEADAGRPPDVQEFLARHPDLAEELASFFRAKQAFEDEATPFLQAAPQPGGESPRFGDYELLEELGRGGMGVVYRARQTSLQRDVALKMILAGRLASAEDVQRFRREAEAAAGLNHPHIVPIYEVGRHDGLHYFSMKLVEGGSLAGRMPRLAGDPRAAARLVATVARAVHHAHQYGILHRDLKPANILLDAQGAPHVTDFGLAKRLPLPAGQTTEPWLTHSHAIVGTPSYMSPEQAVGEGHRLTTRSDVYSLGAILYELLTERPPFRASSPLKVLRRVLDEEPDPPRSLRGDLDRDLDTICLKCLEKDPARRYPSAEALAEDLERWLAGEPIQARPVGAAERVLKWARRRPGVAALAGLLLLSTVLGFGGVLFQWQRAEAARSEAATRADTEGQLRQQAEQAQKAEAALRHAVEVERDAKDEALGRAEGLRLTAHSELVRPTNPGLALVLAIEGASRHRSLLGHNALVAALETCRERRTLLGHEGPVTAAEFSGDGRRVLTTGGDNTARLSDADSGNVIRVFRPPAARPVGYAKLAVARLSPDGRRVLTVSAGHWTLDWGGESTGGAVYYEQDAVRLWDADSGSVLATWRPDPAESLRVSYPFPVCFSPDGRHAAVSFGTYHDTAVRVFDTDAGKELCRLKGHRLPVVGMAFSRDGRQIVTTSLDETARLWDAASGRLLHTLTGHACGVGAAAFSPDGGRVVTVGDGATYHAGGGSSNGSNAPEANTVARVWDTATGKQVLAIQWPASVMGFVRHVEFSPDGRRILTASTVGSGSGDYDRPPMLWDAETGKPLVPFKGEDHESVLTAAFSPDGRRVAVAGKQGDIRVYDAGTGREVLTLRGHGGPIHTIAFSPDGKRLLSASDDGSARVWDVAPPAQGSPSWAPRWQSQAPGAFSPDARFVYLPPGNPALLSEGVRLLEMATDMQLTAAYPEPVGRLVETATGKWRGCSPGTLRLTPGDIEGMSTLARPRMTALPAVFSPDGRLIATCVRRDRTVRVCDGTTLKTLALLPGHDGGCSCQAFSPDGRRIVTADGRGRTWDATTGKLLITLPGDDEVRQAVFSPDGRRLVTFGEHANHGGMPRGEIREEDGTGHRVVRSYGPLDEARVWDVETGKALAVLRGHGGRITAAAFSPDGRCIVTTSQDETVSVWDAATAKELLVHEESTGAVLAVALSPDGKTLLSGAEDRTARLWDVESGQTLRRLKGHPGPVRLVAFSPDGKTLLTAGAGSVRLWDTKTGKAVAAYGEPGMEVFSAGFSRDGGQLLTVWRAVDELRQERSVARLWPVDLLAAARPLAPRQLSPAERELFELDDGSKEAEPEPEPEQEPVRPKKRPAAPPAAHPVGGNSNTPAPDTPVLVPQSGGLQPFSGSIGNPQGMSSTQNPGPSSNGFDGVPSGSAPPAGTASSGREAPPQRHP